jgi:hypothetical protein
MSKFKEEIKQASSVAGKLVFVKVPDALTNISVDNRDNVVRGHLFNEIWTSKKIPQSLYVFNGYSHELTEDKIEKLFSSRNEFYQMCNYHEILYNYSAYTGKWAVLSVLS